MALAIPSMLSKDPNLEDSLQHGLGYAIRALSDASNAVADLHPHDQAKYFETPDEFWQALIQHRNRLDRIISVIDELRAIKEGISR
jgi:DNA-binding transcriptional regulator GbsR (MarR family)